MDILITSASRPKCLKAEMEHFLKNVQYDGTFHFHLHEDVVPTMEKGSKELVSGAKESGHFDTIHVSDPRIGRGFALNKLKKHVKSKYIIYLEEDGNFIKQVDLNKILTVMDNHDIINQVCFNYESGYLRVDKPGGPDGLNHHVFLEREFDGQSFFVTERWNGMPAIGRVDFAMQHWNFKKVAGNKNFNYKLKEGLKNQLEKEGDHTGLEENIGSYFYGKGDDECIEVYVEHTSGDVRHDREFL